MGTKKIHNLIMQQNPGEKEELWSRIESALGAESENEQAIAKPKHKRSPTFWKILSACTSAAVALVIGLGLGIGLLWNKGDNDVGKRYFGASDYAMVFGEHTLKEYSELYQVKLVYLDWYDETEDYDSSVYQLNETGEPICFTEYFLDPDFHYVNIYVTDNRTELVALTWYDSKTGDSKTINSVPVYYGGDGHVSRLNFEYKGYRYYVIIEFEDFDYLLDIAEQMLKNI